MADMKEDQPISSPNDLEQAPDMQLPTDQSPTHDPVITASQSPTHAPVFAQAPPASGTSAPTTTTSALTTGSIPPLTGTTAAPGAASAAAVTVGAPSLMQRWSTLPTVPKLNPFPSVQRQSFPALQPQVQPLKMMQMGSPMNQPKAGAGGIPTPMSGPNTTTPPGTKSFSHAALLNNLRTHAAQQAHKSIKELMQDEARVDAFYVHDAETGMVLDYTRQKATPSTMRLLTDLAVATGVEQKRGSMFKGEHINATEDRAVLHIALRAMENDVYMVDGENVVPEVCKTRARIADFAKAVRDNAQMGFTKKTFKNVLCVGVGGSCLGTEFVYEALRADATASASAKGRMMRFLANVDPGHVATALEGLDAEETLVVISSKTFTTAETILNAKTVKEWLIKSMGDEACVASHMIACSTALEKTRAFGIMDENVFPMWDWVGGRFSVLSSIGLLPLSIHFGPEIMEEVIAGAHKMDQHFIREPLNSNIPLLLGLLAVWNVSFLRYAAYALLPYSQALNRFVAHVQQVDMESNGKRVCMNGQPSPITTGPVIFGEPGTVGQHSFYQLIHQGMQRVACEFIGFKTTSTPQNLEGEPVSNFDELMSNFFAQPDALAFGKTEKEVLAEGVTPALAPHKVFPGGVPSISLLLNECNATNIGALLAIYEHRTAVQGWIWGINSFDQMGVELGKVLAKDVRVALQAAREKKDEGGEAEVNGTTDPAIKGNFCRSTQRLMKTYLQG